MWPKFRMVLCDEPKVPKLHIYLKFPRESKTVASLFTYSCRISIHLTSTIHSLLVGSWGQDLGRKGHHSHIFARIWLSSAGARPSDPFSGGGNESVVSVHLCTIGWDDTISQME